VEEGARDRALRFGIRLREVGERRIGEDDAEAEGIVGRLRSTTVMSCAGSAFFMSSAKWSPAGPAPTQTIFAR
jgi:hypothetical protein